MSTQQAASAGSVNRDVASVVRPKRRLTVFFISFMLVCSVGLNVLLARKVNQLRSAQNASAADRLLKIGTNVPPITAMRLGGQVETISYASSDRPTVLYVFTPQCGWCTRNLDNLKALLEQIPTTTAP